ncbi:hypothetical protein [Streptomyces sp. NPDC059906]|uniref:hypothetical protein n=1 Tax=Streptomyces sp. NPDC059906 TaxID=3346997 RepID=UPI003667F56E
MAHGVDPNSCEHTPEAIRTTLHRRPDWLQAFEQEWLSAAADFACATPGYPDEVEQTVRRMTEDDTCPIAT